ncbi:hypothetical protein KY312_01780 [Candidatus Woesearchaeota archaeon]|nr:hypothetical protein [Candidatus Woesearchaeota archaeon]
MKKILFFLAILSLLSISVSATTDVPWDDINLEGQYCNWASPEWRYQFIEDQYWQIDDFCEEIVAGWVCVDDSGDIVTSPLQSGQTAHWTATTPEYRHLMCMQYVELTRDLGCCCYATHGKYHKAKSASSVTDDVINEVTEGKVFVYKKGEVMDWASSVGLNLPKSYPFLTLESTPVDPIDVCYFADSESFTPWTSSDNFNWECLNLVSCHTHAGDGQLDSHHAMVMTDLANDVLDGQQRDVCECNAAAPVFRTLQCTVTKDNKKVPTVSKKFQGSQLEVLEPEVIDWTGVDAVTYPFVFITNETWEVDVTLYVPEGLEIVSQNPIQTIVANEPKIVQFQVAETTEGAGETGAAVLLNLGHAGKEQQDVSIISSAAVKETKAPTAANIQVQPINRPVQTRQVEIPNVENVPSSEFILFAGVALIVIIAIALYMSLMQKK